ncbi:molybdopterin molybdotransferase [Soonwooa buanensis]|uniref:Molybdopterin molybdenumtransferase n=2 Tax=Soonwooa buanensis TaxID=619805 RepID=A0A1T5CNU4_9FLAO|nr:molybdopterin molybdotransferase [Soonwooa buanensis]
MISVQQAEELILSQIQDFGTEEVRYTDALGRVLAEDILADRDLPPFERPTVDGIAIRFSGYEKGLHTFKISGVQSAGEASIEVNSDHDCIEIMTGAALHNSLNCVIRYEDISIENGVATININPKKGQNIHLKGKDKKADDVLVTANQVITPAIIGIAASVGKTNLLVKKLPKIIVISTGDEMVSPDVIPSDFQLRQSNGITIKSVLQKYQIKADLLHLKDDYDLIKKELTRCLSQYDVLLMSGGVSMGKFDFLPQVCEELGVEKLFHKIKQRPGKPFWFGKNEAQKLVFAFPGNPVSVFMCLHRYFVPWLKNCLGFESNTPLNAVLDSDLNFEPPLQYFAQVKLQVNSSGQLLAKVIDTNGSGDFSHLAETNAFIELPLEKTHFAKGEVYKVWPYNL